jgi:CheY-like chemotaxis protein
VESELGQGSTFQFTAEFGRVEKPVDDEPVELETLHELRVLVVDDNRTNRIIFQEMLSNWGMKPTTVESGAKAIEELDRANRAGQPYRLALLDVMMPEMDGFELVRRIRQRSGQDRLTVLMLSSAHCAEDATLAKTLNVAKCINKPITQSILLNGITTSLSTSRADGKPHDTVTTDCLEQFVPLRILLAEDGLVNRKVAIGLLEKRGHHVTAAVNGKEAVEAWNGDEFDVILMDVQMPEMDGFETTAAIRWQEQGSGHHIPVIAITAHAMKGDRDRCLAAGMDDYIAKPFRPSELFAAVETVSANATDQVHGVTAVPNPEEDSPPDEPVDQSFPYDRTKALANVGGSVDFLREMVGLFLLECPKQLAEIEKTHAEGDQVALTRAAHTLKGSATMFAAEKVIAAARRIETMARAGDLSEYDQAWAELQQCADEIVAALKQELE